MARYGVTAADVVTTGYLTAANLVAGTTVRPKMYDFVVGQSGTPADQTVTYLLQRSTTAATATSVTPAKLDPADPVAIATANENATIEPTYTASTELLEIPLNVRASYRWVAAPGGELVVPAVANNGIGFQVQSPGGYTGACEVSFHFEE